MFNALQQTLSSAWWRIISNTDLPDAVLRSLRMSLDPGVSCAYLTRSPLLSNTIAKHRATILVLGASDIIPKYKTADPLVKAAADIIAGEQQTADEFFIRLPTSDFTALSRIAGEPPFLVLNMDIQKYTAHNSLWWCVKKDPRTYATVITINNSLYYIFCMNSCNSYHIASTTGDIYFKGSKNNTGIDAYQHVFTTGLGTVVSNNAFQEIACGGCLALAPDIVEHTWTEHFQSYVLTKGGALYKGSNVNPVVAAGDHIRVGQKLFKTTADNFNRHILAPLSEVNLMRAIGKVVTKYPKKPLQYTMNANLNMYIKPVIQMTCSTCIVNGTSIINEPHVKIRIYQG